MNRLNQYLPDNVSVSYNPTRNNYEVYTKGEVWTKHTTSCPREAVSVALYRSTQLTGRVVNKKPTPKSKKYFDVRGLFLSMRA